MIYVNSTNNGVETETVLEIKCKEIENAVLLELLSDYN